MQNPTLNTALLLYIALFLAACDHNSLAAGSNPNNLNYQIIEFKRQGGNECPDELPRPLSNTQPSSESLCAVVGLSYPELQSSTRPELARTLNNYIISQLLDEFSDDKKPENTTPPVERLEQFATHFINDYKQNLHTFTSWEIERKASIVYMNEHLISLAFSEYGFTGGAHPFSGTRYAVLDVKDGKPVQLADLLKPNFETPLNIEGEKAFRKVRGLSEMADLDEQGFSFAGNTFQLNNNFAVTERGLIFFFNSYEIAPYVLGSTELLINYEDMRELIRPESLLGQWSY